MEPNATPEQAAPAKQRVRRAVTPEIAALVREEDEALNATVNTAKAVAQAALDSANATIATAQAKRASVLRSVLRQLSLHDADFIGYDGYGADTVLILDLPVTAQQGEE
jgi:hypothetical protein